MNTKRKGAYWENRVKKYLEAGGDFVIRTAASLKPDLVAFHDMLSPTAIECKSNKADFSKKERKELLALGKYGLQTMLCYPKYSVYSKKKDNFVFEAVNENE